MANYTTLMLVEMELANLKLRRPFPGQREAIARAEALRDRLIMAKREG